MNYEKMLTLLGEKIQENPQLRKKLLDNPKETVKELTGEEVPGKITFHTPEANKLLFIIPYDGMTQISDDDLDSVSGGAGYPFDISRMKAISVTYAVSPYMESKLNDAKLKLLNEIDNKFQVTREEK